MDGMRWMSRKIAIALWVATGSVLLGSSCTSDIRDTLVAAGYDFVGDSATTALETLIPVESILTEWADQNG